MKLGRIYQFTGLVLMASAMCLYYMVGGPRFPDYSVYVELAANGGWLYFEDEYFFEWISRGLLAVGPLIGLSAVGTVNLLAAVNQLICSLFFLNWLKNNRTNQLFGAVFILSWFGILFFTTTLRASTGYLCFAAYMLRGSKLDLVGCLLLAFGLAWHDSFALLGSIAIATAVINSSPLLREGIRRTGFNECVVYAGLLLLVFGDAARDVLLQLLDVDLGLRQAYLAEEGVQSWMKAVYCGAAMVMALGIVAKDSVFDLRTQTIAALLSFSIGLAYVFNGVAAVRIAIFAFVSFLLIRGYFFSKIECRAEFRVLMLLIIPCIFVFNIYDVLQRTS